MSKKKPLTPELTAECRAANALFLAKKNELKLSQKKIADEIGISPAGVAQYLNGTNPLNAKFAAAFSRLIAEPVDKFSPRLAAEIARIAQAAPSPFSPASPTPTGIAPINPPIEPNMNMAALQRLKGRVTPRSLEALERIEKAALQGLLKEADLVVLEGIAARLEELNTKQP